MLQRIDQNDIIDQYLNLLAKTLTAIIYDESRWTVVENPRNPIKRIIIDQLRKRSLRLISDRPWNLELREAGEDWPLLCGLTMVGMKRLQNIRGCIEGVPFDNVPGDFVECGVWRGGSCIFARSVFDAHGASDRNVWVADSFEGMPKITSAKDKVDADYSGERALAVSLDQVKENFRKFDLLKDNVKFVKGWFSETLKVAPIGTIAVLRLDGDHYSSTMDALEALYEKVSPGGYIIIDDYNAFVGCKNAVHEFRERRDIDDPIVPIDNLAVFWRRAVTTQS
jgi:O-methyltransferase